MRTPIQLFCFSHAGASAAPFLRWRRLLPAFVEVVPVELPGRGRLRGERFACTLDELLRVLEASLGTPTRPFAFFGHSLGAVVAFAYAQHLRALRARAPLILFASASHAPGYRAPKPDDWSDAALLEQLLRFDGTPREVLSCPELLELALPVMRADYQLAARLDRQLTRAPITSAIHVLAGEDDEVEHGALSAWSTLTQGHFELGYYPGGHFYLQDHEPELLATIAGALMRVLPLHDTRKEERDGQSIES